MNDMVLCEGQVGWIYGFSGGEIGKECIVRDINNEIVHNTGRKSSVPSVKMSTLQLLCHNNNWQYSLVT